MVIDYTPLPLWEELELTQNLLTMASHCSLDNSCCSGKPYRCPHTSCLICTLLRLRLKGSQCRHSALLLWDAQYQRHPHLWHSHRVHAWWCPEWQAKQGKEISRPAESWCSKEVTYWLGSGCCQSKARKRSSKGKGAQYRPPLDIWSTGSPKTEDLSFITFTSLGNPNHLFKGISPLYFDQLVVWWRAWCSWLEPNEDWYLWKHKHYPFPMKLRGNGPITFPLSGVFFYKDSCFLPYV